MVESKNMAMRKEQRRLREGVEKERSDNADLLRQMMQAMNEQFAELKSQWHLPVPVRTSQVFETTTEEEPPLVIHCQSRPTEGNPEAQFTNNLP